MTRHDSSEDYLEAILSIRSKCGFCRNVDIAEHLGLSRPSVTKAVARLSNLSLADLFQDFGRGNGRGHAASGTLSGFGAVRSKNASILPAGVW